jgi:hypothetical protein
LQRGAFPVASGAIWLENIETCFYWKEKVNYKVMGILIFLAVEAVVNSFQKKEKGVNFRVNPG